MRDLMKVQPSFSFLYFRPPTPSRFVHIKFFFSRNFFRFLSDLQGRSNLKTLDLLRFFIFHQKKRDKKVTTSSCLVACCKTESRISAWLLFRFSKLSLSVLLYEKYLHSFLYVRGLKLKLIGGSNSRKNAPLAVI